PSLHFTPHFSFFLSGAGYHRDLHSFPTRRSSDLAPDGQLHPLQQGFWEEHGLQCGYCTPGMIMAAVGLLQDNPKPSEREIREGRSEEHTSELQSRENLVCRLLLEKKKNQLPRHIN